MRRLRKTPRLAKRVSSDSPLPRTREFRLRMRYWDVRRIERVYNTGVALRALKYQQRLQRPAVETLEQMLSDSG